PAGARSRHQVIEQRVDRRSRRVGNGHSHRPVDEAGLVVKPRRARSVRAAVDVVRSRGIAPTDVRDVAAGLVDPDAVVDLEWLRDRRARANATRTDIRAARVVSVVTRRSIRGIRARANSRSRVADTYDVALIQRRADRGGTGCARARLAA